MVNFDPNSSRGERRGIPVPSGRMRKRDRSASKVFEWWLGRGVSPWDEGDVAMAAEWGSQRRRCYSHDAHD